MRNGKVKIINRTLYVFALLAIFGVLLAAAIKVAADAHADNSGFGVLSIAEKMDGDRYGYLYCSMLDRQPNIAGLRAVIVSVKADGFDDDSTADIINYVTDTYCYRHKITVSNIVTQIQSGSLV